MQQVAFAVTLFSFLSCVGSLGLFLFLWAAFRSPLVGSYLPYLGVMGAQILWSLLGQALSLVGGPGSLPQAAYYFPSVLFLGASTITSPIFLLRFADRPPSRRRMVLFSALAFLAFALSPLCFADRSLGPIRFIPSMVSLAAFLAAMLSSQVALIRAYPRVEDRLFRVGVPALVLYSVACVAGGTADSLASGAQLAAGLFPWGILFQPLVVLVWNALSFAWILRFHEHDLVRSSLPLGKGDAQAARDLGLTEREIELSRLLAEGAANKEIASALGLSEHTVRNHIHNIFLKTGARNRVELARKLWGAGKAAGERG